MHNGTLRKAALALTFWLALHATALRAQTFTAPLQASTTGSNPVDFEFRVDGTLIAKGNFGVGSLLTGDQGAGTRMLWLPDLAAFRAGTVSGTQWDLSNIGQASVAFGGDNIASAGYTTALGYNNVANYYGAIAMGLSNTSSGYGTLAIGANNSSQSYGSMALGYNNTAVGLGSIALGALNTAYGNSSVTVGNNNFAAGGSSFVAGYNNYVSGGCAVAAGLFTSANAFASVAFGTYNVGGGDSNNWVSADPLFELGNGTSTTPSDALVVHKDGSAIFQGAVIVAPGGDLSMGSFTAGTQP